MHFPSLEEPPSQGGFLLFRQDSRGLLECSYGRVVAGLGDCFKGKGALSLELVHEA